MKCTIIETIELRGSVRSFTGEDPVYNQDTYGITEWNGMERTFCSISTYENENFEGYVHCIGTQPS